jgi:hypothetical protein
VVAARRAGSRRKESEMVPYAYRAPDLQIVQDHTLGDYPEGWMVVHRTRKRSSVIFRGTFEQCLDQKRDIYLEYHRNYMNRK